MSTTATLGYVISASIALCAVYAIVRTTVSCARACFADFLKTFCCCFGGSGNASSRKPGMLSKETPNLGLLPTNTCGK